MTLVNSAAISFLALFPILNPPAMSPIFLDMTSSLSDDDRHHMAGLIGKYTFLFLFFILVGGGWMLKIFGISVPVIRVAGGLILFNTAWRMLNNEPEFSREEQVEMKRKTKILPSMPEKTAPCLPQFRYAERSGRLRISFLQLISAPSRAVRPLFCRRLRRRSVFL